MQVVRDVNSLSIADGGCVASIGNYDGVHLGHQAIISSLRQQGELLGLPSVIMTFEPHPQDFFTHGKGPARIMSVREKLECFWSAGVNGVVIIRFNRRLADTSAEAFISRYVIDRAGVRHLFVGDDFRFGHERKGDFQLLTRFGKSNGFDVSRTETRFHGPERISSSRVRGLLASAALLEASQLLGRPFYVSGNVIYGAQRGRSLGFPTANIAIAGRKPLLTGVYAVKAHLADGTAFEAVANIGMRPTVDGQRYSLEVHLHDYQGDLYGRRIRVAFFAKLREEKHFNSLDDLKSAIAIDADRSRAFFRKYDPVDSMELPCAGWG